MSRVSMVSWVKVQGWELACGKRVHSRSYDRPTSLPELKDIGVGGYLRVVHASGTGMEWKLWRVGQNTISRNHRTYVLAALF